MGIVFACAVPHPPLIVPAVGRGQEAAIARTIESFQETARLAAEAAPDAVVILSPHAPAYRDGFFISTAEREEGSMAAFGQPQEALSVVIDQPLAQAIAEKARRCGMAIAPPAPGAEAIDHGAYVPLFFLAQALDFNQVKVVRIGLSGLSAGEHRLMGRAIAQAAAGTGRRVALVASGDWSHRLKKDGPYGFAPEGPRFDAALGDILGRGALEELFMLDPVLCEGAGECGLRSFQIMAGALEGAAYESSLLSYEGPFGVGYGVAVFPVVEGPEDSAQEARAEEEASGFDPLVSLARATVEAFVGEGTVLEPPKEGPEEYRKRRAGVFVSLHERGQLRGCIGTIEPQRSSIAQEVVANAIAAASSDPRFPPVSADELDYLSYSVDVLGIPEPVDSLIQLDPRRYGVIVRRGHRRGLLLPDLEGVDTVQDQLAIAKRKAGIGPDEDAVVERFEVIRHSAGGEARRG